MPTRLPNGVLVFNLTPHDLDFPTENGMVVAPSDGMLDAVPVSTLVVDKGLYTINHVRFVGSDIGKQMIRDIRSTHPDALIIGSMIAARAYPKDVVYGVPIAKGRDRKNNRSLHGIRADRFSTFLKPKESSTDG